MVQNNPKVQEVNEVSVPCSVQECQQEGGCQKAFGSLSGPGVKEKCKAQVR